MVSFGSPAIRMDHETNPAATASPRYHESLRVAWLITWRQTVIVLLASVLVMPVVGLALVGFLTTLGVPAGAVNFFIPLIPMILLPAAVQPLLFLMAMNKEYRGFRIEALRQDGHHEDLTLPECIAPSLLLWVGGAILTVPLAIAGDFAGRSLLGGQGLYVFAAPLIQVVLAYPITLGLLFRSHRARFHSFRFHVARHNTNATRVE